MPKRTSAFQYGATGLIYMREFESTTSQANAEMQPVMMPSRRLPYQVDIATGIRKKIKTLISLPVTISNAATAATSNSEATLTWPGVNLFNTISTLGRMPSIPPPFHDGYMGHLRLAV
ncbi:MAG: hypothetical protein WBQ69_10465 [Gallionella sp.]